MLSRQDNTRVITITPLQRVVTVVICPPTALTAITLIEPSQYMRLLHVTKGKLQQANGEYSGPGIRITREIVNQHLRGEITIAVDALTDGKANFLAFDVDGRFHKVLPLITKLLKQRSMDKATFITDGSPGMDRGKIVTVLRSRSSQDHTMAILENIRDEVLTLDVSLRNCKPGEEIKPFPLGGEGGVLRIGGRNIKRSDRKDDILGLDGKPTSLDDLRPLSSQTLGRVYRQALQGRPLRRRMAPWVTKWLEGDLAWPKGGTARLYSQLIGVARDYVQLKGSSEQVWAEFAGAIERVRSTSPKLSAPSPKNQEVRHPLRLAVVRSAWDYAVAKPRRHVPELPGASESDTATVLAMVALADDCGLPITRFGADIRRIASYRRVSPAHAQRLVASAKKAGLVKVISRGEVWRKGRPQKPTVYYILSHSVDPGCDNSLPGPTSPEGEVSVPSCL